LTGRDSAVGVFQFVFQLGQQLRRLSVVHNSVTRDYFHPFFGAGRAVEHAYPKRVDPTFARGGGAVDSDSCRVGDRQFQPLPFVLRLFGEFDVVVAGCETYYTDY
jgi:hypothetical protein